MSDEATPRCQRGLAVDARVEWDSLMTENHSRAAHDEPTSNEPTSNEPIDDERVSDEPLGNDVAAQLRLLHGAPSLAEQRSHTDADSKPTPDTMLTASQVLESQRLEPLLENLQADTDR